MTDKEKSKDSLPFGMGLEQLKKHNVVQSNEGKIRHERDLVPEPPKTEQQSQPQEQQPEPEKKEEPTK